MSPAHFDALYRRHDGVAEGRELFAKDLFGGADPTHRIKVRIVTEYRLAFAVRASASDPANGGRAQELRSGIHHHRSAQLQRRSGTSMAALAQTVIAVNFTQEDDPDRRHLLCRRDEEVRLHHHELPPAGQAGDADALLGQCRQGWQKCHILRPFRHRQDHAFGRCLAHAGGR